MKIIGFLIMLLGIAGSYGVMIFGWGLEPQSWAWIIGGSFASVSLASIGAALMNG